MPYIKQIERTLDAQYMPATRGTLNYALTLVVDDFVKRYPKGLCYDAIADVLSALEGAKLEFYRRVAAPYEDTKILQNGDVYTCTPKEKPS